MPTTQPREPAITIDDQLDLLAARGLPLGPHERPRMVRLLRNVGFQRLSGYWRYFEADPVTHQFRDGFTVGEVADVYEFDTKLRHLVDEGLGVFEIALRGRLCYGVCDNIGACEYLDEATYVPLVAHGVVLRDELIADLGHELGRSKHDLGDGVPPLWLAMDAFSLASVSKMYRLLADPATRTEIARGFGYPTAAFAQSVFHSLTVLRNVCARRVRLWHHAGIGVAPQVLTRLKTDPDPSCYVSTPWASLVVLGDLVDTVHGHTGYLSRLLSYVNAYPQYLEGLKHP